MINKSGRLMLDLRGCQLEKEEEEFLQNPNVGSRFGGPSRGPKSIKIGSRRYLKQDKILFLYYQYHLKYTLLNLIQF